MIQQLALGEVGISYSDYCTMSFGCLIRAIYGFNKRQEMQSRERWEQARFIASTMSKEAGQIKFDWERQSPNEPVKKISKEEFQKILKSYGKR